MWEPLAGSRGARVIASWWNDRHAWRWRTHCSWQCRQSDGLYSGQDTCSIEALGGTMEDVVRTRVYLRDQNRWEEVSRVHGRVLGHIRPANTLLEVSALIGNYEVEIEAEAVVA
jgi:hypothetical protein